MNWDPLKIFVLSGACWFSIAEQFFSSHLSSGAEGGHYQDKGCPIFVELSSRFNAPKKHCTDLSFASDAAINCNSCILWGYWIFFLLQQRLKSLGWKVRDVKSSDAAFSGKTIDAHASWKIDVYGHNFLSQVNGIKNLWLEVQFTATLFFKSIVGTGFGFGCVSVGLIFTFSDLLLPSDIWLQGLCWGTCDFQSGASGTILQPYVIILLLLALTHTLSFLCRETFLICPLSRLTFFVKVHSGKY